MTVCESVSELAASFVSPEYVALMVWDPTESVVVLIVAVPLDSIPVPSVVEPSVNVTVPVAVLGDTAAVRLTDWPKVEGFDDEERSVVVVCLTFCESVGEVLPALSESPEYVAVIV